MNFNIDFNNKKPKLNDDGVMYFLDNKLKNYNIKKNKKINNTFNLFLLIGFICFIGAILYYKYHNKPTLEDIKRKEYLKKTYILNKIKSMADMNKQEEDSYITNLPKFESDYELLHKKFYNI